MAVHPTRPAARPLAALALCAAALCAAARAVEPRPPDEVDELAQEAIERGDYPRAEALYRERVTRLEGVPGHETTVEYGLALAGAARGRWIQGDDAGAQPLFERARAIVEQAEGPEGADLPHILSSLAHIARDASRPEESETLFVRALAIREAAAKPNPLAIAQDARGLGLLHTVQGRHDQAETYFARGVTVTEQAFGNHVDLLAPGLWLLASSQLAQGKLAEAAPHLERIVKRRENDDRLDYESVASLRALALVRIQQGDYAAAAPLWRRLTALHATVYGAQHPRVGESWRVQAILEEQAGRAAESEAAAARAAAIEKAAVPSAGEPLVDVGLRVEAELTNLPLLELLSALQVRLVRLEQDPAAEPLAQATTVEAMAAAWMASGVPSSAYPLYNQALEIRLRVQGREHADTIRAARRLADLLEKDGWTEAAARVRGQIEPQ